MPNIKVAIVEDHPVTRESLAILIGNTPGYEITGRFASMKQALPRLDLDLPHVLLLEIGAAGCVGD